MVQYGFSFGGLPDYRDKPGWIEFVKEAENDLSADVSLVWEAKDLNTELAEYLFSALSDPDNAPYAGSIIWSRQRRANRYRYVEGFFYHGAEYTAVVDLFSRTFTLRERKH